VLEGKPQRPDPSIERTATGNPVLGMGNRISTAFRRGIILSLAIFAGGCASGPQLKPASANLGQTRAMC